MNSTAVIWMCSLVDEINSLRARRDVLLRRLRVAEGLAKAAHDLVYTEKIYRGSGPDKCRIISHPHASVFIGEYSRLKQALEAWEENS